MNLWPKKEVKNQLVHIVVAIVVTVLITLLALCIGYKEPVLIGLTFTIGLSVGIEVDHFLKDKTLYRAVDSIRDLIFYVVTTLVTCKILITL